MPIIERMVHPLFGIIVSRPRTVLAIFLLGTALLGWQARHFRIDASADTLLLQGDRNYIQTQIMNRRFSPQEFLLIAYKPRARPVLSEPTFRDLRGLSAKLRGLERVESVRSILNVPFLSLADDPLSSLTEPSEWTMEQKGFSIAQLKSSLRGHPIYEDLLINKEQTATALQVLFKSDGELTKIKSSIIDLQAKSLHGELADEERDKLAQLKEQAEPLERRLDQTRNSEIQTIRRLLREYEDEAEIHVGGLHVLGFQLVRIIKNDLIVFGSAIAAMISLILYLLFRKVRWVFIPMVCCGCSVLATLGLFGMLGFKATVISSSFIALQLILTLAIVIHLIVQYREFRADNPEWDQVELVSKALSRKAAPCFYAGLINLVGFISLLFSNIRPIIDFGWMMSIAMFFSIGVSLLLCPAMMAMFGREEATEPWRFSRRILVFFAELTLKHGLLIGLVCLVILAVSGAGVFRLEVENSFLNYFRESTRVRQELTFIDQQLGGTTPLDLIYTIPANERRKDLTMTAATVQTLQQMQHALQKHAAIGKTISVVNFTELARTINANRPLTEYEFTALYWTMADDLRDDLLGSFFSPQHGQVRFSLRIQDTTEGLERKELLAGIHRDMAQLGLAPDQYTLTNLFILYNDLLAQLFRSQILTLGIAFGVLMLTILAIFRSVKIALIGIAPNILSTMMVLGIMGWWQIPLDLMTIMIAAVALGITVDDTIHYIHRYLEELAHGSGEQAVARSHVSVGYALIYTTLIVVLGFALLAFSDFVPSILFGVLTGIAMAMAVIFDLSILPLLLKKFVRRAEPARPGL